MKRALLIGINDYEVAPLSGCINDANRMFQLLSRHGDGTHNYDCRLITSDATKITKHVLLHHLEQLFLMPADEAILYFSGHGSRNLLGGYLMTQEARKPVDGFSFLELQRLVKQSPVRKITLILDCCHAGEFGMEGNGNIDTVELREGVSILAACRPEQFAQETSFGGLFTGLVVSALEGEAADVLGRISLAGVYAYIESLLNAWQQRPTLKAHVGSMPIMRQIVAKFSDAEFRELSRLFHSAEYEICLTPEYEPTVEPHDPKLERDFALLQRMRGAGLVEPMAPHNHLYFAAMGEGRCRLTPAGRYYWRLLKK